ncbi:three-Cys-motif partner protein TcmP [Nitrogeniibacter mangrovi]|uniref:Three-Cys-motif partner protein TcmP n=1 Tax=Nitrogeniibacter mangrovi TaxID=2016596 RepID=A0A6C1B8T4_9RHOO|nr:three-Cys-motif partner protein TcmP [Nitrogeniibacter mangrovi]QID19369.1 three-Cys-motif partner protein TcmP [Nitrogeniibacter mangrovi]
MKKHEFGGPWTLIKLDLLTRYLKFFNTALQAKPSREQPFTRIFIDAFAGTGDCTVKVERGSRATVAGSAKIAISTTPAFDRLCFIEMKSDHAKALRELKDEYPDRCISVEHAEASVALNRLLSETNWRSSRGVLFLDPYGMSVDWQTVARVAQTQALDVWYLFPLSAVTRQAARQLDRVDEQKAARLDSVLGTPSWRDLFYARSSQEDAFQGKRDEGSKFRNVSPAEIADFVKRRLESVFRGWVSQPILLPDTGVPLFALYFAVSNPHPAAVALSRKAADHLVKMLVEKRLGKAQEFTLESGEAGQGDFFD